MQIKLVVVVVDDEQCSKYAVLRTNLYLAATSIKRPRPPFGRPDERSSIVFTPI